MIRLVLNDQHLEEVLLASLDECRHRLFIATADVKDLHIPPRREGSRRARSIMTVLNQLGQRGVEIHLLHSGVPSGPLLKRLKAGLKLGG